MELQLSTALAIGTAVFTAGGAWFTVRAATQRLETQRTNDTAAQAKELERVEGRVVERLREYGEKKDDQARRIGRVEERVSVLEGMLSNRDPAETTRRRNTRSGIPVASAAGGEDE